MIGAGGANLQAKDSCSVDLLILQMNLKFSMPVRGLGLYKCPVNNRPGAFLVSVLKLE